MLTVVAGNGRYWLSAATRTMHCYYQAKGTNIRTTKITTCHVKYYHDQGQNSLSLGQCTALESGFSASLRNPPRLVLTAEPCNMTHPIALNVQYLLFYSMLDLSSSWSNNIEWGNILCRTRISYKLCIYISPYYKAIRQAYHIYHTDITWYHVVVIKQGGSQVWQISCQEPHPVSRVGPCQISRINISVIIVINIILILITTLMIFQHQGCSSINTNAHRLKYRQGPISFISLFYPSIANTQASTSIAIKSCIRENRSAFAERNL